MPEAIRFLREHAKDVVFATCALCTLWLVVQNALLLALMPWEQLPHSIRLAGTFARAALALAVPMVLVTGVVVLAWHRARHPDARGVQEARHE